MPDRPDQRKWRITGPAGHVECDPSWGVNYRPHHRPGAEKRAEHGDIVRDLPQSAITEWLAAGYIEEVTDG